MKQWIAALVCVPLAACAPLKSRPLPTIGPPEFAHVVAARPLNIKAGESAAERAAWAIISLKPVVVGTAVLAIQDEHGRSQVTEYDLDLVRGGHATVRSRYVVGIGRCVVMRRSSDKSDYLVIVAQADDSCSLN